MKSARQTIAVLALGLVGASCQAVLGIHDRSLADGGGTAGTDGAGTGGVTGLGGAGASGTGG
ncbi:MAG TPA: hypothetical protein VN903_09995, partial [Polyangia bacterium]|nr:hypothetical protein [Polyangia bacterium]